MSEQISGSKDADRRSVARWSLRIPKENDATGAPAVRSLTTRNPFPGLPEPPDHCRVCRVLRCELVESHFTKLEKRRQRGSSGSTGPFAADIRGTSAKPAKVRTGRAARCRRPESRPARPGIAHAVPPARSALAGRGLDFEKGLGTHDGTFVGKRMERVDRQIPNARRNRDAADRERSQSIR